MIKIKDTNGHVLLDTPINEGSIRKYELMKEDCIVLKFSLASPVPFSLGAYVDTDFGRFEITEEQKPQYNQSTGGYDYELRFNSHYWKWKNKIFKFTPENGGQEASWNLTASLDVQLGIFLRNLKALGYSYNGTDYTFSIDDSVENKAILMSYENTSLLDALFSMAAKDKWDCDCWITDSVIHFGRCEFGDAVKVEQAVNADIARSDSKGVYATRFYAFGSDKNIPQDYRPSSENIVVNGIVQKRLMLPASTPYIDAYRYAGGKRVYLGDPAYSSGTPMPQEEAIENVLVIDKVYPKMVGTMSEVTTTEETGTIENQDGTTTEVKWNAYQYKDKSLNFSKDYVLPGQELQIIFQSGKLNGMVFGVIFNAGNEPEKLSDGSWNPKAQLWEIKRNEDYGRLIPDDVLAPANGDKFVLVGYDIKLVSEAMVPDAEMRLKEEAEKIAKRSIADDGTFTATLYPSWVYEDQINRMFGIGQRINLVASELFAEGRISRVIGYEFPLDIPYDHPTYIIGESAAYSRIAELEEKLESLTYKGETFTGGGGSGIYIIRTNDSTTPTNSNVFSALRSISMFLRKDKADSTLNPLKLLAGVYVDGDTARLAKGAQFGPSYAGGLTGHGGMIDGEGRGEIRSLRLWEWLEVPELRYNSVKVWVGIDWQTHGAGIIESITPDTDRDTGELLMTGTGKLKLEKGQIGAIAVDDICMGIYHFGKDDALVDSDDSRGNFTFAGFTTVYFRITAINGAHNEVFSYSLRAGFTKHPQSAMHFAAYGNFTNKERQTSTYRTPTYTRRLWRQDTWEITRDNIAAQDGDLSNLKIHGLNMEGYSAYLNNIYMSGTIQQFVDLPYVMEIDTQGDTFLAYGESLHVICRVKKGFDDVTHKVTQWKIIRDSGYAEEDKAWAMKNKVKDFSGIIDLHLDHDPAIDDLGRAAISCLFTFYAYVEGDSTPLVTELII